MIGEKPLNPMTEDWEGKPMTIEEKKVVNKKLSDPEEVLGGKLMFYDWSLKKMI